MERYGWALMPRTRQQFQTIIYGKLGLSYGIDEQVVRGEVVLAKTERT